MGASLRHQVKLIAFIFLSGLLGLLVFSFNACDKSGNLQGKVIFSSETPEPIPELQVSNNSINVLSTATPVNLSQFILDGLPPYQFEVLSNSSTSTILEGTLIPNGLGVVQIRITDSQGRSSIVSVNIKGAELDYDFTKVTVAGMVNGQLNSTLLKHSRNDNNLNIARYMNGAGSLATTGSGQPRFQYSPGIAIPLGLLIERGSTNFIPKTQTITNVTVDAAGWTVGQNADPALAGVITSNISNNSLISPEGIISATRLQFTATTGTFVVSRAIPAIIGSTYTASIYVKGRTAGQYITLYFNGTNATRLVAAVDTTKYVRYTMTGVAAAATITLGIDNDGIDINADTIFNEVLDCDVWGAQVEAGAQASTPIVNNGTSLARGEDELKITDLSWLNRSEGTFVLSLALPSVLPDDGKYLLGISNGLFNGAAGADGLYIKKVQGKTVFEVIIGGVSVVSTGGLQPAWVAGGKVKLALNYKGNAMVMYENGIFAGQISNISLPVVLNLLTLGYSGGHGSSSYLNSFISGFKYINAMTQTQDLINLSSL